MADLSTMREITDKLESGIKDLFVSDKYAAYLQTMSRFHRYSTRNTLLIHMQMPTATRVAGYTTWKNSFNRQVKRGEHGIKILAPMPVLVKEELEKLDPVTNQPIIGEDGQPLTEEYVRIESARFKPVSVFDISQTDGEPLPMLSENISGNVTQYELFLETLHAVSPLPIVFADLADDTDGICDFGNRISIRSGMSEVQTVSAVIHEIIHTKLHDSQLIKDNQNNRKDRRTEEIEAESVSYAVCQYYGIETSAISFGYIVEWSKTHELKELSASLDTIRKTAAELIDDIDKQYLSLIKDRGIDVTAPVSAVEQPTDSLTQESEISKSSIIAPNPIIESYTRNAKDNSSPPIGTNILMMPVFDNGNFNREGKKIRVTVEESAGKYQLFSRSEHDSKALYVLTASGRIDHTREYFRDVWNDETKKWDNYLPSEMDLDQAICRIAEQFEQDLADPSLWVKYQHAAILNRLDECEAHNAPVRKLRADQDKARRDEAQREYQEQQHQKQVQFNCRVDEIAEAIQSGKTISVGYDQNKFDGKNPVLALFKLYGINLPLRTQGWVNTGLAEISESGYRYYSGKHKGDSTAFNSHLHKLREAIRQKPIEQIREGETKNYNGVKETKKQMKHRLYELFAEQFPQAISNEFNYVRLESDGFEPLSIEWIGDNRISIMHTYTMNGDLMYDPMMVFEVNHETQSMTAVEYEMSMPPLYQRVDENGSGNSIDGNGREQHITDLRLKLDRFASEWFGNIAQQGYLPVRANIEIDGEEKQILFDTDGNPIMPEPEEMSDSPENIEQKNHDPDLLFPDPAIGLSEMNLYGYLDLEMLPLLQERAIELFDADHPIYLLYHDNTEEMALERSEILNHDGLFGIERKDWELSPAFASQMATASNVGENRETDLLYDSGVRFSIYQINDRLDEAHDYRFAPMHELKALGLSVDRANYELVYTGSYSEQTKLPLDVEPLLNKLYEQFNLDRPADFKGHSLSVSDVVVLQASGQVSTHFVDSIGFVEITGFFGEDGRRDVDKLPADDIETAYSQVGNSSAPNVAKLEADVKAGKSISLSDLAKAVKEDRSTVVTKSKPSLLGKLEQNKHRTEQEQPDIRKRNGLEV